METDLRSWVPPGNGDPCRTMRAWIRSAAGKPSAFNRVALRQNLLDRAILEAIGEALDPAILAVQPARRVAAFREEETALPDAQEGVASSSALKK